MGKILTFGRKSQITKISREVGDFAKHKIYLFHKEGDF